MPVKLRLQRRGRKKMPFYHIVAADARAPRDGKFIEKIGTYNPMTKPATIELDRDRAYTWLMNGAQPTDTVRAILRFKGVLYRKHLQRGVNKGALTQEAADAKLVEWIAAKEAKVASRVEASVQERAAFLAHVSGEAPPPPAPEPVEEEAEAPAEAPAEVAAEATEETSEETAVTEAEATASEATEEAAPEVEETAKEEAAAEEATPEEAPAEAPAEEEK